MELVDEAVAGADFQGQRPLSGSIFCGCQFVLDLLESCCAHLTGIVMRMAFPHNGTSTLTGKTVSCIRWVLHSFSRGGCFLRLQLLVGCAESTLVLLSRRFCFENITIAAPRCFRHNRDEHDLQVEFWKRRNAWDPKCG